MYELFILSILRNFPSHAYLISKIMEPWLKVSRGTLSTLLKKMLKEGFIEETAEKVPFPSKHSAQTYKITNAGKERFYHLMMDTSDSVNFIKLFHVKANNFGLLSSSDCLYLINDFINRCQNQQQYLSKQLNKFQNEPNEFSSDHLDIFIQIASSSIDLQIAQLQSEIDWAKKIEMEIHNGKHSK